MNSTYCVYKLTNTVNNKIYIGITSDFKRRMYQHCHSKDNYPIHLAVRKYGWNKFKTEIIKSDLTFRAAECFEKWLIARERSTDMSIGYNLSRGGLLAINPRTGRHFRYGTSKYGVSHTDDNKTYEKVRYHTLIQNKEFHEHALERYKTYNNEHKEERAESKHRCYENNHDYYLEKARLRRENNRDKVLEEKRKYRMRKKIRTMLEKHRFSPNVDPWSDTGCT